MGGKSSAPSPPDYGPLIKANEKTSAFAMKLAQEQWNWAQKVYNENKGLMQDTNESFLKTMEDARIASEEDRARYKSIYQPQEDRMVHDLNTYDTPERRDKEVGAAQANVAQQFDAARDQSVSQLESFGVNPSATRFASLDIGLRGAAAAAKAAAGTNAATSVEDKGRALRAAAIDIGKGYPSSYTAAGQLGVNAAGGAQQGTTQNFGTSAEAMGTGPQWLGGANNALGNWGSALNNQYSNQLGQFNANQSASSGWGSALGMLGGMAMKRFGFAEGGIVPEEVSPSGGGRQDDVPVAVSVGEFVVPRETVSWFGEKHFHKLTEKAEMERAEQAVPTEAQPAAGGIPGRPGMARGGTVEPGQMEHFPGIMPDIPGYQPPGRGLVPLPRQPGQMEKFPGIMPDIPGYQPPGRGLVPLPRQPGQMEHFPGIMPDIPGYQPPDRGMRLRQPGRGVPPLPGIMPTPGPPGGGWIPGPRDRFSPPISMRPPPLIPHYGPDPGRGVSLGPIAPVQDPYGPDPGRGVGLPRGYPIPQNPYPAPAVPAVGRM